MHVAGGSNPVTFVMSYLTPQILELQESHQSLSAFWKAKDHPVFYAYLLSTDTLQHTYGSIRFSLRVLSDGVQRLMASYKEVTGHALEVVLVSDHANNHRTLPHRLRIEAFLKKHTYRRTKSLSKARDVVVPFSQMTTALDLYCADALADKLGQDLLSLKGIDSVSNVLPNEPDRIHLRDARGDAIVEHAPGSDRYAFRVQHGDPLGYAEVLAQLKHDGRLDARGFASALDWMDATATHPYPAAPERVFRGHREITSHPAQVLAGLSRDYVHAGRFQRLLFGMITWGGAHGSLRAEDSNGILMTNFTRTHDVTTNRVSDELGGIDDLADPKLRLPGIEPDQSGIDFWDPGRAKEKNEGLDSRYRVEIREVRGLLRRNPLIFAKDFASTELRPGKDANEFVIPADLLPAEALDGSRERSLEVRVVADRFEGDRHVRDEVVGRQVFRRRPPSPEIGSDGSSGTATVFDPAIDEPDEALAASSGTR